MPHISRPFDFSRYATMACLVVGLSSSVWLPCAQAQTPASPAPSSPAPASPAPAAPTTPVLAPSHLAIAIEVVKASGLMVMIEGATPNVINGLRSNISRQRPELVKEIEESLAVVEAALPKVRADGVENAAALLAEKMTEAELKDINTFLTSPAGKKYVMILPQFVEEVVPLLEGWGQAASEILSRIFQEEMLKRGHKI